MIDEVLEVQEYLEGKNIDKKHLYRICFLLAKYYKEQGKEHKDIRAAIFAWGKKYSVYITYDVNKIIYSAFADKTPLVGGVDVSVSQKDVELIRQWFDNETTRLVALAVLCYAKSRKAGTKEFPISFKELGVWLQITESMVNTRYIKELCDFGYVQRGGVRSPYSWDKSNKFKLSHLRLMHSYSQSGEYHLKGNDIRGLYREIFGE